MQLPLQITFARMESSPALESRIRELAARLEKYTPHIMRCHVIVQPPSNRQQQGGLFDFHLNITVPNKEIAIHRTPSAARGHEDPYVALRDAFQAARRRLEDYERKRRGAVKEHSQPAGG